MKIRVASQFLKLSYLYDLRLKNLYRYERKCPTPENFDHFRFLLYRAMKVVIQTLKRRILSFLIYSILILYLFLLRLFQIILPR